MQYGHKPTQLLRHKESQYVHQPIQYGHKPLHYRLDFLRLECIISIVLCCFPFTVLLRFMSIEKSCWTPYTRFNCLGKTVVVCLSCRSKGLVPLFTLQFPRLQTWPNAWSRCLSIAPDETSFAQLNDAQDRTYSRCPFGVLLQVFFTTRQRRPSVTKSR